MELHQPFLPAPALEPQAQTQSRKVSKNHLGSYEDFLRLFLKNNFEFCFFQELCQAEQQLALRHDIDFDTSFALQTARIETRMGVKSTYFFMLRSNMYNILSADDFENIKEIRDLGHQISVHFDPVIYEDFHAGLKEEVSLFESCFKEKVQIVSFHRPNAFFQNYDAPVVGIEHTYQSRYFRDIKYFSDSTGIWRFGHPAESLEFAQGKSLHILIHPIWWMVDGKSNVEKLETYYGQRIESLKKGFFNNCIPFRKIHDRV